MRQGNETVLRFLELVVGRLAHLETLLMGLATVGLAGWAFVHSKDYLHGGSGPVLFATLFSGLIASAYSMLYVARMALNVVLLELERDLGGPVNPYRAYFRAVGRLRARFVYYLTATFVPALALGSLILIWHQQLRGAALPGVEVLRALWILVLLCTLVSTGTCLHYIEKTMAQMSRLTVGDRGTDEGRSA